MGCIALHNYNVCASVYVQMCISASNLQPLLANILTWAMSSVSLLKLSRCWHCNDPWLFSSYTCSRLGHELSCCCTFPKTPSVPVTVRESVLLASSSRQSQRYQERCQETFPCPPPPMSLLYHLFIQKKEKEKEKVILLPFFKGTSKRKQPCCSFTHSSYSFACSLSLSWFHLCASAQCSFPSLTSPPPHP